MIPLLVFTVHVIAVAAGFTRRWQQENVAEGFLAVFFMALIFFVGWSISSFLMKLMMSAEGLGPMLNRDAASLLFLTVSEAVFYYFYLRSDTPQSNPTTSAK
jgi:hypothetical protein